MGYDIALGKLLQCPQCLTSGVGLWLNFRPPGKRVVTHGCFSFCLQ